MYLRYNIQPTSTITKGYNPTSLEIFVGTTATLDDVDYVSVQTITTEPIDFGTRTENRTRLLPLADLQQMVESYDLATGQPIINVEALNMYLTQFNLEII